MNRITPDEVVSAYRATGLKPARGDYFPQEGCACAFGVLARNYGSTAVYGSSICFAVTSNANISYDYGRGLIDGWDGDQQRPFMNDYFKTGYEDGCAAWQACVDAGLVKATAHA